jgi:predicted DNA-binding protein
MATEVVSLRLPQGTVRRLRELAHRRSLERGTDVTWAALVREAIAALLRATTEEA